MTLVYKRQRISAHFYIPRKAWLDTTYIVSFTDFDILCRSSGMSHFDINCVLLPASDGEDEPSEEAFMEELQADIFEWFRYCRIDEIVISNYYYEQRCHIFRFLFTRNNHMFMLGAMKCNTQ